MKNKAIGSWFAVLAMVLAVVGLVTFLIYTGQGGKTDTLVIVASVVAIACEASLLLGEKIHVDFAAVIGAAALAAAMMLSANTGMGNMADAFQGIVMFGNPDLAVFNYAMIIVYGLAIVCAIAACFTKKEK